ncbi:MAG: cytochrome c3 family protein [Deltaproteobacteria bacterium]|nr:cytochrome c3 family protein [Deltaproteobacteria bacterium]
MSHLRLILTFAALLAVPAVLRAGPAAIAETRHNLSVSGPGPIRATNETRICVFCHTPHTSKAEVPLWNRDLPDKPFLQYTSPSSDAEDREPVRPLTGTSRLCMACHDGTIALGAVKSQRETISMIGTEAGRIPSKSASALGHDLSGSHPVSMQVTPGQISANNARDSLLVPLESMKADSEVRLDGSDQLQCTTCHDPHDDSNFAGSGVHFYRKASFSDVCTVCHKL